MTAFNRAVFGAIAAVFGAIPFVQAQEAPIDGVFALPGVAQAVEGELDVTATGPLTREIVLRFTDPASGKQIADFDVELTQQLHILGVDAGLTRLIHENDDELGADGSFTAELTFPVPGLYHIYADVVPTGFGQQVMRFDVVVGDPGDTDGSLETAAIDVAIGPIESSDGPYSVTLDASKLQADIPSEISLFVERDGAPAEDLEPYLGVSAHAVFIRAEDLAYVHAHATEAGSGDHSGHGPTAKAAPLADAGVHQHDNGEEHSDLALGNEDVHAGHGPTPVAAISPAMSLHVTTPEAGRYALWSEFIGGGEVRAVPFTIEIPEAGSHGSH